MEYNTQEEPLVISKALTDKLLQEDNPTELIGLYLFYYYTAKWQETNQPKATIAYVARGLKWGEAKVRKNKKRLVELGLLEDIKKCNPDNNKVIGWYVKLNFLWTEKSHPINLPQCGKSHSVAKKNPNAYNTNNINADNTNNINTIKSSDEDIDEKDKNWTFVGEVKKLKDNFNNNGKNKNGAMIAYYMFDRKKMDFRDKKSYIAHYKRCLKAMSLLSSYSPSEMKRVMDYCESEYEGKWTLETVAKKAPEVIKKSNSIWGD